MKHMLWVFLSVRRIFVQMLGLQDRVFCPYFDFRKCFRQAGAVILGSLGIEGLFSEFLPKASSGRRVSLRSVAEAH
jgi:hypothetical protein